MAATALAFAGMAAVAPSAMAVHDLGLIELEGDAVTQITDDWDEVCKAVTITNDTTSSIPDQCATAGSLLASNTAVAFANDGSQNATIFTGGGSKDPNSLTQWAWKDQAGGLPDKDNLQDAFAARYSIPESALCPAAGTATNCEVLYFGSDRFDNSGDAQQGFWFFQNQITLDPATGKFVGVHKTGDLLILSDFSNGGQVSTINIYRWTGDDATGSLTFLTGGAASKCGGGSPDAFCGIVNPANGTTSPWSFTDKSGNHTFLNGEFYEGGVNLSDPSINLGGECFSSFAAETRSSTSTTATLKDFVLGQFALCSATLTTTPSAGTTVGTAVLPGTAVTDLAVVQGQGTSSPPTPTGNVSFFLCGPTAADSTALCTTGGTAAGVKPLAPSAAAARRGFGNLRRRQHRGGSARSRTVLLPRGVARRHQLPDAPQPRWHGCWERVLLRRRHHIGDISTGLAAERLGDHHVSRWHGAERQPVVHALLRRQLWRDEWFGPEGCRDLHAHERGVTRHKVHDQQHRQGVHVLDRLVAGGLHEQQPARG